MKPESSVLPLEVETDFHLVPRVGGEKRYPSAPDERGTSVQPNEKSFSRDARLLKLPLRRMCGTYMPVHVGRTDTTNIVAALTLSEDSLLCARGSRV